MVQMLKAELFLSTLCSVNSTLMHAELPAVAITLIK